MIRDFVPIIGSPLQVEGDKLRFKGGRVVMDDQQAPTEQPQAEQTVMGLYVSKEVFSGGVISAKVTFEKAGPTSGADIIIAWDPATGNLLNAGIPAHVFPLLSVRAYDKPSGWNYIAKTGDRVSALQSNREYHIEVALHGSLVSLRCDGVESIRATLPKQYPPSQIGLLLIDESDILISDFTATVRKPRAFVICQFSSPYNEVYMDVIKSICKDTEVDVVRADETPGPGMIISDVIRDISDSNFVIADITPVNANVFYELGYAAGINKPAILIAERGTKLPFDVSPYRTLFYDNTIAGKAKLEKGLRDAIFSVLGKA